MSLPALLSIANEAKLIEAKLTEWAEPRGGVVKIMANMRHLWEEVVNPNLLEEKPRLLVCYEGETPRGGPQAANVLHRVDRQWKVVVLRGHGFTSLVAEGDATQPEAFYDSVETIRDLIRCMASITEERPVQFTGIRPLPNVGPGQTANVFMDAFSVEFSTANDIGAVNFDNNYL